MKKITAALMATCMLAGAVAPAAFATDVSGFAHNANWPASSQEGLVSQIDTIRFTQTSYDIAKGSSTAFSNFDKTLPTTESNSFKKQALVRDESLVFSLQDNDDLAFAVDSDGVVSAIEDKGTAILIAKTQDGKVIGTTKLNAVPSSNTIYATGFSFTSASYTLPKDEDHKNLDASNFGHYSRNIEIQPSPTNAKFTEEQATALEKALENSIEKAYGATIPSISDSVTDPVPAGDLRRNYFNVGEDGKQVVLVATATETNWNGNILLNINDVDDTDKEKQLTGKDGAGRVELVVDFPRPNDSSSTTTMRKTTMVKAVDPVSPKVLGAVSSVKTLQVGDIINVADLFKIGPSGYNVNNKGIKYYAEYANDAALYNDYAVLENGDGNGNSKLLAVAEGEMKVVAELATPYNSKGELVGFTASDAVTAQATVRINVVEKSNVVNEEVKIEFPSSVDKNNLKVGDVVELKAEGLAFPEAITWSSSDESVLVVAPVSGETVKLYVKGTGTATITATYDQDKVNDLVLGSIVDTVTITVTEAATEEDNKEEDKDTTTTNPQTGDSFFTGLFF